MELFCAKSRSQKHQIFKKSDDFANRPYFKGYSPCQGFPPCKMLSLGQKLKMPKSCEKPFFKNITVVLCKKPLEKTPNETILKMGYLPKTIAHAKAIAFAKWSVWVKNLKMPTPCEKPFYTNIRVVLCKKPLEKTPNIREMRRFLKPAILQRLESMPRVYLLQNGHFGSKIKNAKIMQKNHSSRTLELVRAKNRSKKHQIFEK